MRIEKTKVFFLYNIPVTEELINLEDLDQDIHLGVSSELIKEFKQAFGDDHVIDLANPGLANVGLISESEFVPGFYTKHYRDEHTPYKILPKDHSIRTYTFISVQKLNEHSYFKDIGLTKDIKLNWQFTLSLQSTGLITFEVIVDEPINARPGYHISGLHLNNNYKVVDTKLIQGLWCGEPVPPFITLDELAKVIRKYYFFSINKSYREFKALNHEIQIPFTSIEVCADDDHQTQHDFISTYKNALAELVFKPESWEVEEISKQHSDYVMRQKRVWSVAKDAFAVVAYEGILFVKIKTFDYHQGDPITVSDFRIADEYAVLHSFKVAVSNYHFLRILDGLLDSEAKGLIDKVSNFEQKSRKIYNGTIENATDIQESMDILMEMNKFSTRVMGLQFTLTDLLEEIYNSDKLIDEEWHIQLLDKLNDALGTALWLKTVKDRIDNIGRMVGTVENVHRTVTDLTTNQHTAKMSSETANLNEKLLLLAEESKRVTEQNADLDQRLQKAQPVFLAVAAVEGAILIIDMVWGSSFEMVNFFEKFVIQSLKSGLPNNTPPDWIVKLLSLSLSGGTCLLVIIFLVFLITVGARKIAKAEWSERLFGF